MNLRTAAGYVEDGGSFSSVEMQSLIGGVLQPGFGEEDLATFLLALARRGETADEILGAVLALRGAMIPFDAMPEGAIDTCGTGGDGKDSFNLSTATAIVAAAAGAKVVKHGNRSVSSKCGSADLLEAAGVRLELNPAQAAEVLESCGIVFLYAPAFHPALRHVAPVRRALGQRTLFNFVGPLVHPGKVKRQLLGISDAARLHDYAYFLESLACERGYVVHGADGADELTLHGLNQSIAVGTAPKLELSAKACGLAAAADETLAGGDATTNLGILHALFEGHHCSIRDAVLLNTATALVLAEVAEDLHDGVARAAEALDSAAAKQVLAQLVACSQQLHGGVQ